MLGTLMLGSLMQGTLMQGTLILGLPLTEVPGAGPGRAAAPGPVKVGRVCSAGVGWGLGADGAGEAGPVAVVGGT